MTLKPPTPPRTALLLAALAATAFAGETGDAGTRLAHHPDLVARLVAPDARPLESYRARRRLSAETRHGKMRASIDAWTSLSPEHGFSYEIASEEGSGVIRRRVLIAALDAERDTFRSGDARTAALTPDNYDFLDAVDAGGNLLRVGIKPKRRHVLLIDGTLLVTADSADLVQIEGALSKRPSFWTRRVNVTRTYGRVAGIRVPLEMRSTSDVLIAGPSSFDMTYCYVEINRIPVDTCNPESARTAQTEAAATRAQQSKP